MTFRSKTSSSNARWQSDATGVPTPTAWRVPEHWRAIDFISDLHLAESTPRTFAAFAAHLRGTDADAVVILGDLFEVWVGDDARQFGFEADCTQLLADATSLRVVAFMAGNRDFLLGAQMLAECGLRYLPDPTLVQAFGDQVLLTHGDALCLSDIGYQQFRSLVRSPEWQEDFLGHSLPERRRIAAEYREESQQNKMRNGTWVDVDKPAALAWLRAAGSARMIHGHTHMPADETIAPGFVRHVLSDWDLDDPAGTPRAQVLRWEASGLSRMPPAD
jgi:UDP-2,3-diacylglucosamine hydrolase